MSKKTMTNRQISQKANKGLKNTFRSKTSQGSQKRCNGLKINVNVEHLATVSKLTLTSKNFTESQLSLQIYECYTLTNRCS